MKTYNAIILILILLLSSCGSKKEIQFCEGTDTDGDGVNCGNTFSTGDLSAVIESSEIFGSDSINVKISNINEIRPKTVEELKVKVNSEESMVTAPLSFYTEGAYRIEASVQSKESFASGDVKIVDR